jgi:hypothetical protein
MTERFETQEPLELPSDGDRDELLPEELAVGSDDPQAQAAAVLAESRLRTEVPDAAPDTVLERRTSAETADPVGPAPGGAEPNG